MSKLLGCQRCGRVAHGIVDCRYCALNVVREPHVPRDEREAFIAIAFGVLAIAAVLTATLRMPEPRPLPRAFAPVWSGPKPAAVQLAGVRERKEQ